MNEDKQSHEMNEAVLKALRRQNLVGRTLTASALGFGLLSIAISILLAVALATILFPRISIMVTDYAHAVQQASTNSVGSTDTNSMAVNLIGGGEMSSSDPNWRHVVVTLGLGKAVNLMSLSLCFLGVGTFLTLLLTIFNRRVTLRQINLSLAQISQQIKELQDSGSSAGKK
jgi:hypothetical protein